MNIHRQTQVRKKTYITLPPTAVWLKSKFEEIIKEILNGGNHVTSIQIHYQIDLRLFHNYIRHNRDTNRPAGMDTGGV
jgi:hypothetical protein